jgi:peptide/nickel transport system permease protein
LLPVLTVAGLNMGVLLGGLVLIEKIFNWPGIGHLVIDAVMARDFPIVQAGLLLVSVIFVTVNFGVDLLYAVLDPRVRLR